MDKKTFSKEYTLFFKGIAIIILLFHHLMFFDDHTPLDLLHLNTITDLVFPLTKVCVPIFTLLSGYGINESSKKKGATFGFAFAHIKKMIVNYWWAFVPMVVFTFFFYDYGTPLDIYGRNLQGLGYFILDVFGLSGFLSSPGMPIGWYIETILCCYLLFPVFSKLIKKVPYLLIALCIVPIILAKVLHIGYTNREIFYFLPFVVGMFLSEKGLLNKLIELSDKHKALYLIASFVFLVLSFILISTTYLLLFNTVYAFGIIAFGIGYISITKFLFKPLGFLGKHSMNVFLVHGVFLGSYSICNAYLSLADKVIMFFAANGLIRAALCLIICVPISILMERLKKLIKK